MGGQVVLPEPDANITKCIKNFKLTPKDLAGFWKVFQKLDRTKSGLISLQDYFKSIECERNMITDCLLELLEIEHGTFESICETYAQDDKRTISKFVIVSNLSSLF